jgi:hypothetical protein
LTAGCPPSEPLGVVAGLELAEGSPKAQNVIAVSKPNFPVVLNNPLQFIVFVRAFMTLKFST